MSAHKTTHHFDEIAKQSFVNFCNIVLEDSAVADRLPINPEDDSIFTAVSDGLILAHLIAYAVPESIDVRALNENPKNVWENAENLNLVIESARAIGTRLLGIGQEDIANGSKLQINSLLWQIIRIGVLNRINVKKIPTLVALLEEGEDFEKFLSLPPEDILLRWVNYHISEYNLSVSNLEGDLKSGGVLAHLIHKISKGSIPLSTVGTPIEIQTMNVDNAETLGVRKYIFPEQLASGNPRFCLAFTASLFNAAPCLEVEEDDLEALMSFLKDFDFVGSRRERTYASWMSNMGASATIKDISTDLQDGIALLEVVEKMGYEINWDQVDKKPRNNFAKLGNIEMFLEICSQNRIRIMGIGPQDIFEGKKQAIIGVLWQLMAKSALNFLSEFAGGRKVTERDVLNMCNDKLPEEDRITSFTKDSVKNGHFYFALFRNLFPKALNNNAIVAGETDEEKEQNAKYVLSVARKVGAQIFTLWEDIVEGSKKPCMMLGAALIMQSMKNEAE
ncbi:hypothetical protein PCE1_003122 [Barthelona sp. PCE]